MKKIINFFKSLGGILLDLFISSNRWMHIIVGGVICVAMMAVTAIWTPYSPIPGQCCSVATLATLIAMASKEYADKAHGGKFDWKDIFAGAFPALCIDILCVILLLIK